VIVPIVEHPVCQADGIHKRKAGGLMTTAQPPKREVRMPNDANPKPTPAATKLAVHHRTFAEGESHPADHPEEEHVGTFAEGECEPEAHPEDEHVGTFAEGECEPEAHPEEEDVGTFAEGKARV
jgi:hypothetical protein